MLYDVIAHNLKTNEFELLDSYVTRRMAERVIANNLEWDEDDDPADWEVIIRESEDDYAEDGSNEDFGFDPYMGCYSDDC